MCVICIKPAGHKLPSRRELYLMYLRNHDGCGFVSETRHCKSLDFEDFYNHLRVVPVKENCIIHFRLATHGSVCESNCHPFYDKNTGVWFAHNGILSIKPKGDMTDSETAFRRVLLPALHDSIYSPEFAKKAKSIIGGSKFAFMQDGQLRAFGHFIEYGGCFYSNLHHLNVPSWYATGS